MQFNLLNIILLYKINTNRSYNNLFISKDAGTNPGQRSSTATIILEIDEENSYPESPSFVESYYTATYSNETDYHDLTINGDITLSSGSSDVNITIQGSK